MSGVGIELGGAVGQPPAVAGALGRPRWWRRWWWLITAGAVLVSTLAVLTGLAAAYQPVAWGGTQIEPTGAGVRAVNTFGHFREDFYVPPQRGQFSFFVSLFNYGPQPVTIESLTPPLLGGQGYPVRLAGPVLFSRPGDAPGEGWPAATHVLRDVTVQPGQGIYVQIRLRTASCASKSSWMLVPSFFVKERFLFFTHTVALPWSMAGGALIMHGPGGHPGGADTLCAAA